MCLRKDKFFFNIMYFISFYLILVLLFVKCRECWEWCGWLKRMAWLSCAEVFRAYCTFYNFCTLDGFPVIMYEYMLYVRNCLVIFRTHQLILDVKARETRHFTKRWGSWKMNLRDLKWIEAPRFRLSWQRRISYGTSTNKWRPASLKK